MFFNIYPIIGGVSTSATLVNGVLDIQTRANRPLYLIGFLKSSSLFNSICNGLKTGSMSESEKLSIHDLRPMIEPQLN